MVGLPEFCGQQNVRATVRDNIGQTIVKGQYRVPVGLNSVVIYHNQRDVTCLRHQQQISGNIMGDSPGELSEELVK